MEYRRFLDRLLLVTIKVLQACQEDAKALPVLEPLLQKLDVLRQQSDSPETWDILSVWDWAHGEMSYRTKGGTGWFSARPTTPRMLSLQDSRVTNGRRRRPEALQRQGWVHFVVRMVDRMFLRASFVGWTWARILKDRLNMHDANKHQNAVVELGQTRTKGPPETGSRASWFSFMQSGKEQPMRSPSSGHSPQQHRTDGHGSTGGHEVGRYSHNSSSHGIGNIGGLDDEHHKRGRSSLVTMNGDDVGHYGSHSEDDYSILPPPPLDEPVDHFDSSFGGSYPNVPGRPQRHGHEGISGNSLPGNAANAKATNSEMRRPISTSPISSGLQGGTSEKTKSKARSRMATQTFTICLDKANNYGDVSLGLEVMEDQNGGVLVQAVTGGLAGQWNANNPDSKVEIGDRITEVNGAIGAYDMLKRCKEEDILMVTLERAAPY
mmetsp:Transcript_74094/g.115945  ORF Transcript_74094/g.115945 Transcript_74094/m.115945 type:complete len:435 (+) Transcript_74094:3-1307(+)